MRSEVNDLPKNGLSSDSISHFRTEDEIDFLGYSQSYFVSFIDIVNSTKIASSIDSSHGVRKYYGIFLNTLARIARDHGGRIVKNAGDSLILYFPKTSDSMNTDAFKTAMNCCFGFLDAHSVINLLTNYENLPKIEYRISADYGKVEVARSRSSMEYDLIGNTMNICAKMNPRAKPQGFVIGSDLYEILKGLKFPFCDHYDFRVIGEYSTGLKYNYPIFEVNTKNNTFEPPLQASNANAIRHRIMIVDDEPDVLLTYKSMLEDEELFEVETYTSSHEALEHLLKNGPSSYELIITDIRMPPPNGLQLYNIVKSLNKQTKVLFITAYDVIEEVVSMLPDIKHKDVLKKPISKQDLIKEARLCVA